MGISPAPSAFCSRCEWQLRCQNLTREDEQFRQLRRLTYIYIPCLISWKLQSQTKIVGTLNANPFFSFPVLPFSLPMLFIAIQSANRVHQHWEEKKTQKRPNNFDCDCSFSLRKGLKMSFDVLLQIQEANQREEQMQSSLFSFFRE